MSEKRNSLQLLVLKCVCVLAVALLATASPAAAQVPVGTAFTYQGDLQQSGAAVDEPVNGCDFEFSLWNDPASVDPLDQVGSILMQTELVDGGRFTATLDFGADIFTGEARWLEIAVCCAAPCGSPTTLIPRQELTPAPYALALPALRTTPSGDAGNPDSANVIGGHHDNTVGAGVGGGTIAGGGTSGAVNTVSGDFGTVGGGHSNTASQLRATVGGGGINAASGGNATVGGGRENNASGANATIGGGRENSASGVSATVAGGGGISSGNTASGIAASVGGGSGNAASGERSTVAGGQGNTASGGATARSTVGGGVNNNASGQSATIAGGESNTASGIAATVGGGSANTASGLAATVPGGGPNTADGDYSFAAGQRAQANHDGSFVWSDNTTAGPDFFSSTEANQFLINASGGVGIGTTSPVGTMHIFDNTSGSSTAVKIENDNTGAGGNARLLLDRGVNHRASEIGFQTAGITGWNLGILRNGGGPTQVFAISQNADINATAPDFAIDASGKVGIGTAPAAKLHVAGTPGVDGIMFPDGTLQTTAAVGGGGGNTLDDAYDQGGGGLGRTITADSGAVEILGPDGLEVAGSIKSGSSITIDGTANTIDSTADLDLRTGGTSRIFLDNTTGNVGIGTNSPGHKLEVVHGTTDESAIYAEHLTDLTPAIRGKGLGIGVRGEGQFIAVAGVANPSEGLGYGVLGQAGPKVAGDCYGIAGYASGDALNIGVYGNAVSGTTNWAGYFDGRGYFSEEVGIGTNDPLAALDISATGDGAELLRLSTERPWVFRQSGAGLAAHLDLHATTNNKKFFITGQDDVVIAAFDGDAGDHRVGIGTDTPAATLDVRGTFEARGSVTVRDFGGSLRAQMTAATGGYGAVATRGPNGNHNFFVGALTDDNHGYAVVRDAAGTSQAGMYVDGAGNGIVFGDTKSFRVPNPADAETEIWYASIEGPEAAAYVRGTAHLVDGRATITFPEHFRNVATTNGMTVHLTPLSSESRGLAIVEKALEGVVVHELSGGTGSYDFDYVVMAVRQGHEDYQVIRPALASVATLVDTAPAAEDLSADDAKHRTARLTDDPSAGVSEPDPVDASTLRRDLIAIRSQMEQRIARLEQQLTQLNETSEVEH